MSQRHLRHIIRAVVLSALVAGHAVSFEPLLGQLTDGVNKAFAAESATYRRVFVPADRPEEWPTDGERYLPIDRAEFERLVKAADERRQLSELGGAQLLTSRYTAKLEDDLALAGQATFGVKLLDQSPRVLTLSPLNVAVGGARWADAGADEKPALVGTWNRPDDSAGRQVPAGQFGVLVERSGELVARWSARSQSGSSSNLEYRLELPAALEREMIVDLPADCSAAVSSGRLAARAPVDDAATTRWTFQLSAAREHRLQIRRGAAAATGNSAASGVSTLPLVAVAQAYGVTPQGLQYEAELRVQQRSAAAGELHLTPPPTLRVAEILVDGMVIDMDLDSNPVEAIVVPLPRSSSPISVTIRGVAETVVGEPWQLPSIAAQNAFWTEGTSTLWIDPTLELQSLTPRLGSLLNLVGVGRSAGGEAYRLQAWSREASTEVIVAERTPQLHAAVGVVAEFAERELAGRCQAQVWATGGSALHVTASLESQWDVESVEATPADALAQWHVSGEGPRRRLHVQLRRTPTELAPIRLSVSARKPLRGWAPVATLGELEWIRFAGVTTADGLLLVRDHRGHELQADRSALDGVVSLESLSAARRELIGEPSTGMLFATAEADRSAKIRVVSTPARFQGEAWIGLTRTGAGFEHSAEILCRPTVGAVSELIVAAARALPADAHWTLVGSDAAPVVAPVAPRRSQTADAGASPPSITQYRVRFAQPPSDAFRLRVTWRGNPASVAAVNSMTLPGAESWQSRALLRGNAGEVQVDARQCQPAAAVPAMGAPFEEASVEPGVLGCYRLGEDPSTPLALAPTLTVAESSASSTGHGQGEVVCWMCDVATLQFADGNQTHRLAYHLEVNGGRNVELTLPKGCDLVSARVGDAVVAVERTSTGSRRVDVPLPSGRRAVTLAVDVHSRRRALDAAELVAPPLPRTSFPVLRGRWTISAPAPFTVESETVRHASAGWRQRLFGPLDSHSHDATSGVFGMGMARGAATPQTGNAAGPSPAAGLFAVPQGWSSATQDFVTSPEPIEVRRIDDMRALWHVTWLIAAVVAARLWSGRPRWVALAVGVLAIGCLLLPLSWIVLPQAILLGTLAGIFVREILSRFRRPDLSPASSPSRVVAIATSLLVALASANATVHASDSAPPPGVLYPLGDDQKPVGADVYVPASLLSELLPSTQRRHYDGASYALMGAVYQIDLTYDAARSEVAPSGAAFRFRVRTFQRNVQVALPLEQAEADWLAAQHTVDGAPTRVRWDPGGGCRVDIREPGEHELELKLVPRGTLEADRSQLSLRVPPIAGAVVEIGHPAGMAELTVGSDELAASAAEPTRTVAKIAASDVLKISWANRPRGSSSGVSVDQLTWLAVDPTAARVEVRLRLAGDATLQETLTLASSPQLKLLPLSEDLPVEEVQTSPGPVTITELKFRAPPQLPMTIALQFQVQRSVSVGRIDFPSVRVLGAQTASHQFAASIDRRLRTLEEAPVGMAPAPVSEIERVWGVLPAPPELQYTVTANAPAWSMTVEPTPARFTSRESVDVLCSAEDAQVSYAAKISEIDGDVLVYRLAVSPSLRIEDVSASLDDEEGDVAVRWARPRPDVLCVFLSRPLNEPHTLNVSARAPVSEDRRLPVPRIGLESTRATAMPVSIRRSSEVLVSWSGDAEAPSPATATMAGLGAAGLPVGQYSVARNAELIPELEITSNEARLSADALLTLDLKPTEPVGAMVLHGRVTRGVVDRVRLIADKNWRGPLIAEPAAVVVASPSPQDADRQVIEVRLNEPVAAGNDLTVKLSGPVALETDQRVRFPNVRLLDVEQQRTFLVLPKTPANQTAEWTIQRLQEETLPVELAEVAGQSRGIAAYQAQGNRFVAEQRVFPEALRKASVRLAQTQIAVDDAGDWSAVTQLIVQAGGASDVVVKLVEDAEWLHVAIDDRAVVQPEIQHGQWTVPAGPRYLPRVLTIAYRGRQDARLDRLEFQAPQAYVAGKPLPLARSLWQVEGGLAVQVAPGEGGRPLSERGCNAAARREQIATVVDASLLAFQLPEWELKQWFHPWLERLQGEGTANAAERGAPDEAAWRQVQTRISALASDTDDGASVANPEAAVHEAPASAWFQGTPDGRLTLTRVTNGRGLGRWFLALAIAGAWGAAWRYSEQRERLADAAGRWPAVLGVLAGVLWWALLSPALLGPVIIAFSLATVVKNWQFRRQPAPPAKPQVDRG